MAIIHLFSSVRTLVIMASLCLLAAALAAGPRPALGSPTDAASPDTAAAFSANFYGILLSSMSAELSGVESFGRANGSAPTSALLPVLRADPGEPSTTFQVQQSRIGAHMQYGDLVHGQLEVDFIDFGKASPTVQALPRLRIASIDWKLSGNHRMFFGQGWDIFSPLMPIHTNLVGANFTAGNVGFMRHQVGWLFRGTSVVAGLAAGLPSPNPSPVETNVEASLAPTAAGKVGMLFGGANELTLSAIYGSLRVTNHKDERINALGVALNATLQPTEQLELRIEAYFGQNLANLASLSLSQANGTRDVREAGGWLSAQWAVAPDHVVYGTAGFAALLNPGAAAVGYTIGDDGSAARDLAAGPGIENNLAARVGYAYSPVTGLRLHVEPYIYRTTHKLLQADAARFDATRLALGVEIAAIYRF